ncbi:hypothetical protein HY251_00305 [bacterium]|nr:hypothetical protein [bacterium]
MLCKLLSRVAAVFRDERDEDALAFLPCLAVALALSFGGAFLLPVRADEPVPAPAASTMMCPRCGRGGTTKFCGDDGVLLVRADLIVFHRVVSLLATGETRESGLANPFKPLLGKDGTIDPEALERLAHDYAQARKSATFAPYTGPMPIFPPRDSLAREASEAEAVAVLRSIVAAEMRYRDGSPGRAGKNAFGTLTDLADAKLLDGAIASGKKDGWVFDAGPSTQDATSLFYATAFPERSGAARRFLFVNQAGHAYAGTEAFAVDRKTCNVPPGLARVEEKPEPRPSPELEPVPGLDELRVGQVFVIRSNNGTPVTMKHAVTAKDDTHVTLTVLLEAPPDSLREPQVDTQQLSLFRARGAPKPTYTVVGHETLEVSSTKFDCEIRESTNESKLKERIWYCERHYPYAIKRVDETGKATWELIEIREP